MDPNQTPPQVGVNSSDMGASATGQSVFANAPNRFKDTTPKGDIIIPPSTPEKPKGPVNKKLVIGIIIGVAVLIAAIVLVIVLTGNKSGSNGKKSSGSSPSSSSISSTEDIQTAFNKYANFIISGEASTNRISSRDKLNGYIFVSKFIDHDEEFLKEAKELFDNFYSALQNSENLNVELFDIVEGYKQIFDGLYEYEETGELPESINSLEDAYYEIIFDCYDIDSQLYNDTIVRIKDQPMDSNEESEEGEG